jgi:hypothetical protein
MTALARLAAAAVLCGGLVAFARAETARAELVAGVDIERRGNEALITIRFTVPILYSGHEPADAGRQLRIYPGVSGAAQSTPRGRLRLPQTDMVPLFTVTYPEPDDALLIEFDQPTRFEVHPNERAISVTVPVLPGANDWVVITNDWSLAPAHADKVVAALEATPAVFAEAAAPEEPEVAEAPPGPPPVYEASAKLVGFAGGGSGVFAVRVDSMKDVRFATVVRQQQDWSCGSAAVATLLTYHYNHPVTETEALLAMYEHGNQDKIRREGFSLLDIKRFLESLGYQANGFETSIERLVKVNIPAIVIINDNGYNHFVVVKGLRHGSVLLGDSAKGNRVVSRAAFEAMWRTRIVFVITSRRDGVAFNFSEDWRFMAAPLGDALGRESLAASLLVRAGPNDF